MEKTNREQKTFTTKANGYEVVALAYLTGREYGEIEAVYLGAVKVGTTNGKDVQVGGISAMIEQDAQRKMLELMLISIKGKNLDETKPLVEQALDIPATDYLEIVDELSVLSGKKKSTANA